MATTDEMAAAREKITPPKKRSCPDCGGFLFLEFDGEEYWWSCLMCGWHKPMEGLGLMVSGRSE